MNSASVVSPAKFLTGFTIDAATDVATVWHKSRSSFDPKIATVYLNQWKLLRQSKSAFPAKLTTSNSKAHPVGTDVAVWFTRTNKLVFFDAPHDPTGTLVDVLITRTSPWFLEGQLLTPAPLRSRRLPVLA